MPLTTIETDSGSQNSRVRLGRVTYVQTVSRDQYASYYIIITMNIIIVLINLAFQSTMRAGDQKLIIDLEWPYIFLKFWYYTLLS